MTKPAYDHYRRQELILRDHLAVERTALANERTLLAYVRTMLAIMAVGGTLIKFFTDYVLNALGWLLLLFGIVVVIVGFARYIKIYAYISQLSPQLKLDLKNDRLHRTLWFTLERLHLAHLKVD